MGGVPLVASQVNTNFPSPLDEFARAEQLRSTIQGQQIQQQQIQMGQMELNDQKTLRSLAPSYATRDENGKVNGFDSDGYYNAALAQNVNPQTIAKMRMSQAQMTESLAKASEATLNLHKNINDQAYQLSEGFRDIATKPGVDPNQVQQAYQGTIMKLKQLGVPTDEFPAQYAGPQSIDEFQSHLGVHSQILADAQKQAQIGQESSKKRLNDAEATSKEIENKSLQSITPDYINTVANTLYPPDAKGNVGQQNQTVKQQALNMLRQGDIVGTRDFLKQASDKQLQALSTIQTETNPQVLSARAATAATEAREKLRIEAQGVAGIKLTPAQINTVLAINEGRETPPSGYALSTPYWQAIMGGVTTLDPQWSEQRAQLRKGYTQDKEIGAINTALGHAGVLNKAIDALNNGKIPILNSLANQLGVQVGEDPVTTFKTIVHRVGPEISKAYLGAGGSAGERGTDEKDFSENLAPTQLKNNVAMTTQLLGSKIASKAYQWDVNKSDSMSPFNERFIMPGAKEVLDNLAPNWKEEQKVPGTTAAPAKTATTTPAKTTAPTASSVAGEDFFSKLGGHAKPKKKPENQ